MFDYMLMLSGHFGMLLVPGIPPPLPDLISFQKQRKGQSSLLDVCENRQMSLFKDRVHADYSLTNCQNARVLEFPFLTLRDGFPNSVDRKGGCVVMDGSFATVCQK